MVIAGSDRTTRRRAVRRQRDPSSFPYGEELHRARQQLDLSLDALGDRTGVRPAELEALEDGDLSRFPDEGAALRAVRRCAETLGLDPALMTQSVGEVWRHVVRPAAPAPAPVPDPSGAPRAVPGPARGDSGPVPLATSHLSRYPGDSSHLRAFTQTAQVPQVAARTVRPALPPGLRFDSTDSLPVTRRARPEPRPAPLVLRVAVWSALVFLVLGAAGLAVHHWRPAWLTGLHLVATTGPPSGTRPTHGATPPAKVRAPLVRETTSGPLSAAVTVGSPAYAVVVTTAAPCWIHVTSPASFAPVFSATVPAGTTKSFTSASGQLSLELGASHAAVTVQIFGRTVPGFLLTPASAPYVVNFHSSTT